MVEIRDYEVFKIPPRWLVLKIETDNGIVGWGEPIIEGRADTVQTAVEELLDEYLVGQNPFKIEDHWQMMYRGGFFRGGPVLMSAIAGIDQALWDIKGKHFDIPVYELLGGATRDRIQVYQTAGSENAEEMAQLSVEAREKGFSAIKLYPAVRPGPIESVSDIESIYQLVATVRDRVGKTMDVGVHFHGRISPSMLSRLISKLKPLEPMFVEEPIRPEFNYLLGRVRRNTTIPFAFGERLYSRWDFRPHFEAGRIDIAQPDLSHAGGISEVRRIANLAETYGVALAVNCPNGPVAYAAATQLNTYATNSVIQPSGQSQYTELYLENPEDFEQEDGYVTVPEKPGLGIVVDEDTVRERSMTSPDWRHPVRRHDDHSLAEW